MFQLMFNAADLIVVGRFAENGGEALAAVGGTGPLINLVINLFIGLSVGTSVFVARYIGSGEEEKTHQTVHTSMLVALIGGVICFIVGFFFSRTFLEWMGTIESVLDLSTLYMQIYFIGIPASLIYNFGAAILRASGDTVHPLIFLSIAGVANVILNLVMVLCFHRSVDGVAIASAASQIISAVLVVWYLCVRVKGACKLDLRKLRIYPARLWELIRIGIPAGIQGSLFSISNIIIQSAVNSFDSAAVVSGSVAAGSIEGFIYVAMNSFHHAALSFIGQNIGAGKAHKIGKITGTCIVLVVVVGLALGVFAWIFAEPLLKMYIGMSGDGTVTTEAIHYGMIRLQIIAITYFTCGMMDVFSGSLRGMGASLGPTLICLIGVCGIRITWIFTYFQSHHTMKTLFFSYPLSWTVTVLAQFVFFLILKRKFVKKQSKDGLLKHA
ncbi:MAG: MATE family efflux transporter [Clostridia bacterium]|nr:MATE family efflux transporter [Clostridia bacterium]